MELALSFGTPCTSPGFTVAALGKAHRKRTFATPTLSVLGATALTLCIGRNVGVVHHSWHRRQEISGAALLDILINLVAADLHVGVALL